MLTSVPDVPATLASLPSTPASQGSRMVLEAFFDAYNRQDQDGVIAAIADPFVYGDCDFSNRRMYVFHTRDKLEAWLAERFAAQDRFVVEAMIIAPAEGSPPNDPRNTAVEVRRIVQAGAEPRRSLIKIVLNAEGNRIQYLNTYGNVDCETGR